MLPQGYQQRRVRTGPQFPAFCLNCQLQIPVMCSDLIFPQNESVVNDRFHNQKEHAGLEFMTSINLLSNKFTRKVCQGVSSWRVCYLLVNWTVFSVWEILYFDIAHGLMVNIKYKKY